MKKESLLAKFEDLPLFTISNLKLPSGKNLIPTIKYNLKTGKILRLKKGVYVSSKYLEKIKYMGRYEDYLEFVANKLVSPSYLSGEYMLWKYSILSEAPSVITSITKKTTRIIENDVGKFSYSKVKDPLFGGFIIKSVGEFNIFLATKIKALFDFLYLKKRILGVVEKQAVEELRLNLDEFSKKDREEFEKYLALAKSPKLLKIYQLLFEK